MMPSMLKMRLLAALWQMDFMGCRRGPTRRRLGLRCRRRLRLGPFWGFALERLGLAAADYTVMIEGRESGEDLGFVFLDTCGFGYFYFCDYIGGSGFGL